ncbi:M48 family metallopeptidase [Candidatus Woesearchaeota archaeon]|nr:M48 family metallopeptidase [Candidatus Woesearchaeota archaeon]
MNLIEESYHRLFPDKEFSYKTEFEYNRRLSSFNSNIKLYNNTLSVAMNLQWKDIDDEIKIGLIQHLLLKVLKQKATTSNIHLYHHFTKNIPSFTPKEESHPVLAASFARMNQQFFSGAMEQPNLRWGSASRHRLAYYNLHDDSITVSTLFQTAPQQILDYLLYHEMLHKHFQFEHKNGRSHAHTPAFRAAEAQYPNQKQVDVELNNFVRQASRQTKKSSFWSFLQQ